MTRLFQVFFLLTTLGAANLFGQKKVDYEWYLNESNGGLCNQSLLLFKDSSYCTERGCEASSNFSFGQWTRNKDTIKFIPADPAKYKLVSKVETSKTDDKNISVIIYDIRGNNITNRIVVGQYVKNAGIYNMDLDSSKTKQTDFKRTNGIIVLKTLQRIFSQKVEIVIDTSNVYEIYLNIPGEWNFQPNSNWDGTSAFSLRKDRDKLVSTLPDHFDDEGNLVPSEYIKQTK